MSFSVNIRLQGLLLAVFAFLLYANTLGHGFVMDDSVVLTQNRFVQEGIKGIPQIMSGDSFAGYLPKSSTENVLIGGRYRPLSMAFFAVLVQFFGNNSLVFHLFALILYALSCLLLYQVLLLALKPAPEQATATWLAWGTALLFAAHPVHTEVVASVKGCDEQLAFLAGMGVLYCTFRAADTRQWKWSAGAGILFLLACLAKENAISLLLLAPLALWYFRGIPIDKKQQVQEVSNPVEPKQQTSRKVMLPVVLQALAPLVIAFAMYIAARSAALHWHFAGQMMNDPLNNPFLKSDGNKWAPFSATEKYATILFTLLQYARLLVWPYPLTHDYYPFQIGAQKFSQPAVLGSIVLYLLLVGVAVWGIVKRNKAAFGILFYLLSLIVVANIFVPVGTFMAERFLFLPSMGICFTFVALLSGLTDRLQRPQWMVMIGVALSVVVFSILTVLRNPAWANDKILLETDLSTSPNSAKLRNSLGTILLTEALQAPDTAARRDLLERAEIHLKKAVELHPTYYDAILAYGACSFYLEKYDHSIAAYRGAVRMNPDDAKAKTGLGYALRYGGDFYARQQGNPDRAIGYLTEAWELNPDTAIATHLASQYVTLGKPADAAAWLEKAVTLAPDEVRLLEALRQAYTATGNSAKAAEIAKRLQLFTTLSPANNKK